MSELDSYADLFAEAGGFDIPASVRTGASLQATANMKLHLDYELIWFSETDSVGNGIENLFGCPTAGAGGTDLESCLGGSRGPGFKWDDVGAIKIGAEWALANDMILRAGYS
jgi:long-chain fatty acid transport protein